MNKVLIPDFLPAMINDLPNRSKHQKHKAYEAALDFIVENGAPPYNDMDKALDFFSAIMKAAKQN